FHVTGVQTCALPISIAEYDAALQMVNPLKVLTSGVERQAETAFFAGHRWRYSDRVNWWDEYDDITPVVIGHYWRLFQPRDTGERSEERRVGKGCRHG